MTMANTQFKRFMCLCIAALSMMLYAGQARASLQAHVDRNPVALNESFNLILQSDDGDSGDPDLSALKRDFDILGQSKSNSVQIANGRIAKNTTWQINVIAKHAGQLHIPAIAIGGQSSAPITVDVSEAGKAQASQESGNLFLEVGAEPQVAHVQQQVVFTVRLYSAVALGNGSSLSAPNFPDMDAVVERLGEDRSFQTVRNGQAYSVIERRFALFPQKSGQFNSDPIIFDGNIVDQNQNDGFFMFAPSIRPTHHLRVRSNTVSFTVKPIPAGNAGGQWLPTSTLQLSEQWSANPPTFTVGEPITRTLVETAVGLTSAQLPTLESGAMDGFKLYPDQPQLKDDKTVNGITGKREQKIAYIPTRPGKMMLPAIDVKWWNTTLDKEEVASLPARSFNVLPAKPDQAGAPPVSNQAPDAWASVGDAAPPHARGTNFAAGWWPWMALFLGVGWCSTLFAWWRGARRKPQKAIRVSPREETLKGLEKQLKRSCLESDPVRVKTVLLAWAKQHWPENPPVNLAAIGRRCSPEFSEALADLDRALYANAKTHWQGETLWTLYSARKPDNTQQSAVKAQALDALYPPA